jgi:hypothetical protein
MTSGNDQRSPILRTLEKCRNQVGKLEKGFHKQLYEHLQTAGECAQKYAADEEQYALFREEIFWARCKLKKPSLGDSLDQIILNVCRFVFDAADTAGARYNRAYKYARTLQAFARKKVPVSDIAAKLMAEHGTEYAFETETAENPRQSKPGGVDGKGVGSGEPSPGTDGGSSPAPATARKRSAGDGIPVSPDGERALVVETSASRRSKVLNLAVGERARITVQRVEADGDFKRIAATCVKVRPSR